MGYFTCLLWFCFRIVTVRTSVYDLYMGEGQYRCDRWSHWSHSGTAWTGRLFPIKNISLCGTSNVPVVPQIRMILSMLEVPLRRVWPRCDQQEKTIKIASITLKKFVWPVTRIWSQLAYMHIIPKFAVMNSSCTRTFRIHVISRLVYV